MIYAAFSIIYAAGRYMMQELLSIDRNTQFWQKPLNIDRNSDNFDS